MTKSKKILLAIVGVCFIFVAFLISSGLTFAIESFIYSKIQLLITPTNTVLAIGITYLSEPITVTVLCLILIVVPYTRRRIALPVSACAICATGLNWALKQIFVRERPNIVRLVAETGYSFPSGHSATSAAIGTILVLLIVHFQLSPPRKYILTALCCSIPFLIGISRIYLGVHYAGDVVAGWLLGIFIGTIIYVMWSGYRRRETKSNET